MSAGSCLRISFDRPSRSIVVHGSRTTFMAASALSTGLLRSCVSQRSRRRWVCQSSVGTLSRDKISSAPGGHGRLTDMPYPSRGHLSPVDSTTRNEHSSRTANGNGQGPAISGRLATCDPADSKPTPISKKVCCICLLRPSSQCFVFLPPCIRISQRSVPAARRSICYLSYTTSLHSIV